MPRMHRSMCIKLSSPICTFTNEWWSQSCPQHTHEPFRVVITGQPRTHQHRRCALVVLMHHQHPKTMGRNSSRHGCNSGRFAHCLGKSREVIVVTPFPLLPAVQRRFQIPSGPGRPLSMVCLRVAKMCTMACTMATLPWQPNACHIDHPPFPWHLLGKTCRNFAPPIDSGCSGQL